MNKTIGYWIEKLSAFLLSGIILYISYKNWEKLSFLNDSDFLDKIVGISSTLFGFLLAILTLIIQSESKTISDMKNHGSFSRLISLNKITVLSSIMNCIFSFFISISKDFLENKSVETLKILECLNISLFGYVIFNTLIFTLIFYKIINEDARFANK